MCAWEHGGYEGKWENKRCKRVNSLIGSFLAISQESYISWHEEVYICAESITFHRGTSSDYCIRDESFNWPCLAKNHPGSTCGAWKTFSCNYESVGVRLPLAISVCLCRVECEVNWEWHEHRWQVFGAEDLTCQTVYFLLLCVQLCFLQTRARRY